MMHREWKSQKTSGIVCLPEILKERSLSSLLTRACPTALFTIWFVDRIHSLSVAEYRRIFGEAPPDAGAQKSQRGVLQRHGAPLDVLESRDHGKRSLSGILPGQKISEEGRLQDIQRRHENGGRSPRKSHGAEVSEPRAGPISGHEMDSRA